MVLIICMLQVIRQHDYNASHRAIDLTGNPEIIYWRKYQLGVVSHHQWTGTLHQYNGGATKSMVEDYLCTDGLPITLSPLYQGDEVYENIFKNRDPRLRQTILHPDDQAYYNYDRKHGLFVSQGYRSDWRSNTTKQVTIL